MSARAIVHPRHRALQSLLENGPSHASPTERFRLTMIKLQSYVCGSWHVGQGEPRRLYNPATEEPLAEVNSDGIDFGAVVRYAREVGVPAMQKLTFAERAAMLKALSKTIYGAREELIELSTQNGGNTRGDAKFDIDGCTGTLAAYASVGAALGSENSLPAGDGVQLGRTPKFWGQHHWFPRPGLSVHINAFNFPAWGMGEKMAVALLCGVPVVEKPGTPSALLAWRLAQIIVDSDILPAGAFQFICGGTGDLLDHLGPQDSMSFTGSSGTAAMLKATPNLVQRNVRINLEADSLNAAILGPDVDDDSETYGQFVANIVTDMTQKAGQKCTAVRRIIVPSEKLEQVVEDLCSRIAGVVVGDPADAETGMGPVASRAQHADVRAGIDKLATVAKVACGGSDPVHDKGYFVAPTLFVATDPRTPELHAEEVFGPVAVVMPYSGEVEEAIEIANLGGGGLVCSVYVNNRKWQEALVRGIAPWHGRVWLCSEKVASQIYPPGMVLPQTIHGGPGRAGGGEELGGLLGLEFYMQRTAVQGFQGLVARAFGPSATET